MLYVFWVDSGVMMTFEMNIALESVLVLKRKIHEKCSIPIQKQVLLINGGELLDNDLKVCNYNGTGTDTSPIYLFNLGALEAQLPQTSAINSQQSSPNQHFLSSSPSSSYQLLNPKLSNAPSSQFFINLNTQQIQQEQQIKLMKNKVSDSLLMEPSYSTIVARTEISKKIRDLTTQQLVNCEQLIRDQHLQHQGWRAAVANLEDLAFVFDKNVDNTSKIYKIYLEKKPEFTELLNKIKIDLELLDKIPILEILKDNFDFEELKDKKSKDKLTLLDWINSNDNQYTLNNLLNNCFIVMDHFNEENFKDLKTRIEEVKLSLNNEENKKIRKIEDRLYQLDELLVKAKKIVNDQNGLTNAFIQNQNSAGNIHDQSIFNDLCTSHQTQLKLILQNFVDLSNIKMRYLKAKHELIFSLHAKLKNIIRLEEELSITNSTLMFCTENLRKLLRNFDILKQVHLTPKVYFYFINELLRRNTFTKSFNIWFNNLNSKCNEIYLKESNLRQLFKKQVSNHFLNILFKGLDDDFPKFFFKDQLNFDENLKEISLDDLNLIKNSLPEINEFIKDLDDKHYNEYLNELKINEELINENMNFEMLCMNCFQNQQLNSNEITQENENQDLLDKESLLKCKESFENVKSKQEKSSKQGKSSKQDKLSKQDKSPKHKILSTDKINKQDISKKIESSSEDDLGSFEKLFYEIDSINSSKNFENTQLVKQDSTELASEALEDNEKLENKSNKFDLLKQKIKSKLKEQEQDLMKKHEKEIKDLNKNFEEKLKIKLNQLEQKLKSDHKLEIDTIRSRFKLACAIDRSVMESSIKVDSKKNFSEKN